MSEFTREQIDTVYRVIAERRDMRHFRPDPLDEGLLAHLLRMPGGSRSVAVLRLGTVDRL